MAAPTPQTFRVSHGLACHCINDNMLIASGPCIPASSMAIQNAAFNCVLGACPGESLGAVLAGASAICACEATATQQPTTTTEAPPDTTTTTEAPPDTTTTTTGPPPDTSSTEAPPDTTTTTTSGAPPGTTTTTSGGPPTDTSTCTTEAPPDTTTTEGPSTTCAPGTKQDCGPVASSAVPHCAKPCFDDAAPKVGCDATDYACQCQADKQSSLSAIVPACVATACPPASIPAVLAGASSVCACANAAPTPGPGCTQPTETTSEEPPCTTETETEEPPFTTETETEEPTCTTETGGNPPGGNPTETGGNPPGGSPTGGNPPGGEPTGGNPPGGEPTQPPTVTAGGARHEVGIVAGVFAAVWLAAIAL